MLCCLKFTCAVLDFNYTSLNPSNISIFPLIYNWYMRTAVEITEWWSTWLFITEEMFCFSHVIFSLNLRSYCLHTIYDSKEAAQIKNKQSSYLYFFHYYLIFLFPFFPSSVFFNLSLFLCCAFSFPLVSLAHFFYIPRTFTHIQFLFFPKKWLENLIFFPCLRFPYTLYIFCIHQEYFCIHINFLQIHD